MWLIAAVLLLAIISCGGGGGTPGGLSGDVNTDTFSIPAGSTMQVTGTTRIMATTAIVIDGTLNVDPTADLYIEAPSITVTGTIQPTPSKRAQKSRMRDLGCIELGRLVIVTDIFNCNIITHVGAAYILSHKSKTLSLKGAKFIEELDEVYDSLTSTYSPPLPPDCGSIGIGSQVAMQVASQMQPASNATIPQSILIDLTLRAGNGIRGAGDPVGKVYANGVLRFTSASGGKGGSININSTGSVTIGPNGKLQPGKGGDGGPVGPSSETNLAKNGADGQKGQSVVAVTGDGGAGGDIKIQAQTITGVVTSTTGQGGWPGGGNLASGNGGARAAGGDLTITSGYRGARGLGSADDGSVLTQGLLIFGGNGGASNSMSSPGGACGAVSILNRDETPTVLPIRVDNGFNGGAGFGGCGPTPIQAGSNGGRGGFIGYAQAKSFVPVNSFAGGAGGDGLLAGAGGPGGFDDFQKKIGSDGKAGTICGRRAIL